MTVGIRLSLQARLPEYAELLEWLERMGIPEQGGSRELRCDATGETVRVQARVLAEIGHRGQHLNLYGIVIGPDEPGLPTLALVGGVHGLERIGSQVLLSYLRGLSAALRWDELLRGSLKRMRILLVPIVNPVGMALNRRSNGRGVDLMRNAPSESQEEMSALHIYRGHRLSSWLPWFRGNSSEPMEREAAALCEFFETEVFPSRFALSLDVHSGFHGRDRIWFPYARSRQAFPGISEVYALKQLLRETNAEHRYLFEPQALNYTTHGDLWDHLHDRHLAAGCAGPFLPLTLELSAASWVRKNPTQLVSRRGLFHPVKLHRLTRVLRRHQRLLEFLGRAVYSYERWVPTSPEHRQSLEREAFRRWGLD